jgi:hypothetical protein
MTNDLKHYPPSIREKKKVIKGGNEEWGMGHAKLIRRIYSGGE